MFKYVKTLGIAAVLASVPALVSAAAIKVYDRTGGGNTLIYDILDTGNMTSASVINGTSLSGNMTFSIITTPQDVPGLSLLNTISITTNGLGILDFQVTEDDYGGGANSPDLSNVELSVTASTVGGRLLATGWVDNNNAEFGLGAKIGTNIEFFESVIATDGDKRSIATALSSPFSMSSFFRVSHNDQITRTSFDATQVAAIPVPAAGLLLLTALGGLGVASRRRKAA